MEGNRRVAALELLQSPDLLASLKLEPSLKAKFKQIRARAGQAIPTVVNCSLLDREEANHWIMLRHTGQNEGVGVVPWDGRATQHFRGSSPALQAIEMVEDTDLLDEETRRKLTKIPITNLERLLSTPEARKR